LVNKMAQRRVGLFVDSIDPQANEAENRRSAQFLAEKVPRPILAMMVGNLANCFCRMEGDPVTQYRVAQALRACATEEVRLSARRLYACALHPLAQKGLDEVLGEDNGK
jgi:hypothetical protein